MQNWYKLGCLFCPANDNLYLVSHAANPLPTLLRENIFRIFYSGRNKENKSSVAFVDINIKTKEIINYPKKPIVVFGSKDSFFSHGISIGNLYVDALGNDSILFMGWQCPENTHWRGDIGKLNVLDIKGDSPKVTVSFFMGSDEEDPVSLSYPFVLFHNNIYKMWYGSTLTWDAGNGEMLHVIKYATSEDAIHWKKQGIAVPYEIGVAQAFSKPSIIIDDNGYHMWFSFRSGNGTPYRIGYAESVDGINWTRKDNEVGLDVSSSGWDSEMICYPFVFDHNGNRYMLYNGNGYGRTGFGLAVLEQD